MVKIAKVAIVGAHGVGKTTLLNDERIEYPKIMETARKVVSKYIGINKSKYEIEKEIILEQTKEEEKKEKFLADRSFLDIFAYSIYFFTKGEMTQEELNEISNMVLPKIEGNYDAFIYIPIMFELVEDGVRMDKESQQVVDDIIHSLLEGVNVPVITLNVKDLDERVRAVNEILMGLD